MSIEISMIERMSEDRIKIKVEWFWILKSGLLPQSPTGADGHFSCSFRMIYL